MPPFLTLEDLYIDGTPYWEGNIENTLWLELLHPFTGVKNPFLSWEFVRCIGPALEELVEDRMTEVLPALQNIFLEGQPLDPAERAQNECRVIRTTGSAAGGCHRTATPIAS